MRKLKTLSEAETARRRAVTGLHNLGLDDDADRIEGLSTKEYATEKGIEIVENPTRRNRRMARRIKSREELEAEVEALQSENEELQGQLDDISEILGSDDEEAEAEEDEYDD
jgi:hypothetical protein